MPPRRQPTVTIGRARCPWCRSLKFSTDRTRELPGTNSIERRATCKQCGKGFVVVSEDCPDLRVTDHGGDAASVSDISLCETPTL